MCTLQEQAISLRTNKTGKMMVVAKTATCSAKFWKYNMAAAMYQFANDNAGMTIMKALLSLKSKIMLLYCSLSTGCFRSYQQGFVEVQLTLRYESGSHFSIFVYGSH